MSKKWYKKLLSPSPEAELEKITSRYEDIVSEITEMRAELLQMRQAFAEGGSVTWEQLQSYAVSTPDNPVGYPTGKNCISYRLPNVGAAMMFRTVCVAPEGEVGSFGWHDHPKSYERNVQIAGNGRHAGRLLTPFSVTEFAPGETHDYELEPGASLLTTFHKVLD